MRAEELLTRTASCHRQAIARLDDIIVEFVGDDAIVAGLGRLKSMMMETGELMHLARLRLAQKAKMKGEGQE